MCTLRKYIGTTKTLAHENRHATEKLQPGRQSRYVGPSHTGQVTHAHTKFTHTELMHIARNGA